MTAEIIRAQLDQHVAACHLLGIVESSFGCAATPQIIRALAELPKARHDREPRFHGSGEHVWTILEWVRVEYDGVTFSASRSAPATMEEAMAVYRENERPNLRSVP